MTKICTSLEQSKRLVELGIDVKTANMYWKRSNFNGDISWKYHIKRTTFPIEFFESKDYVPAWSLSALLDLLPKGEDNNIDLCFGGYNGEEYIDEWFCTFEDNKEPFEFHTCNNKDKLDAVFEIIVWLKENGKI